LPLKLGVGLICMVVFSYGIFCMVALFKSSMTSGTEQSMSIDMQFGGYNPHFVRLGVLVGVIGVFTSFAGFLGVYDDKPSWIRVFWHYLQIAFLCNVILFAADMWTLSYCEDYAASLKDGEADSNQALYDLSSHGMCHWGRIAYILGFAIATLVAIYMLWNVWKYMSQLELNPPYPIDFGYEKYDTESRWKFYEVKEPEEIPMFAKQVDYDATSGNIESSFQDQYGPDGTKNKPTHAPDGSIGPAYIRAFRH